MESMCTLGVAFVNCILQNYRQALFHKLSAESKLLSITKTMIQSPFLFLFLTLSTWTLFTKIFEPRLRNYS